MTVHMKDSTKDTGTRSVVVGITNAQVGKNMLSRCLKNTGILSICISFVHCQIGGLQPVSGRIRTHRLEANKEHRAP